MRTDLRAACAACDLRLPDTLSTCPRCKGPLARSIGATPRPPLKDELRRIRPVRDAFLYVPLALAVAGSAVSAILLTAELGTIAEPGLYGMVIALIPLGFLAGLLGIGVLSFFAWLPWALLVLLVFAFVPHEQEDALARTVRVIPFADLTGALVDERRTSHRHPVTRAVDYVSERKWRFVLVFALLWGGAQLVAFLHDNRVQGQGIDPKSFAIGVVSAVGIETAVFAMLFQAFRAAWQGGEFVVERLVMIATLSRAKGALEDARDPELARAILSKDREGVEGKLVPGDAPLRSPIDDTPCAAFRLLGRAGGIEIDDVEATPFVIEAGPERVAVRAERFVVIGPTTTREPAPVTGEARDRVRAFLARRGVALGAEGAEIALVEIVVEEGAEVTVHGAIDRERLAGAGYRGSAERRVVAEGDGRPVLVIVRGAASAQDGNRN